MPPRLIRSELLPIRCQRAPGAQRVAGTTVDYVYDLAGRQIAEVNTSGGWTRQEAYVGGRHLATYSGTTTYFHHSDWLGTERARTDVNGAIYETCQSLPYGDGQACVGGEPSPMHFTGKQRDAETNLDDFPARYYSSTQGRWLSPDWDTKPVTVPYAILGNPQTLNLYSYVGGDPTNHADADGHMNFCPECMENASDFLSGLKNALVSDNLAGVGREDQGTTAGQVGAAVGDAVAAVQGTVEGLAGGTAAAGGVAACSTGAGCVAGAPAAAAGSVAAVHGATTAAEGLSHLFFSAERDLQVPRGLRLEAPMDQVPGNAQVQSSANKPFKRMAENVCSAGSLPTRLTMQFHAHVAGTRLVEIFNPHVNHAINKRVQRQVKSTYNGNRINEGTSEDRFPTAARRPARIRNRKSVGRAGGSK